MFRLVALFLLLSFGLAPAVFAQSLEQLAKTPLWLDLLHINQGGTWRNRGESYVKSQAFFLAEDGHKNPLAELQATIAAFQQPDHSARCQFPARYRFLADQLGWQQSTPFAGCDDYLQWRAIVPDQQVVLAFPSAYLNSPSSMFGHVFLRLDASAQPDAVLQSWAVSYAARTNPEDNSIFYTFKGIFGSYPGFFSVTPYGEKLTEYSHLENRDIWEYQLNLTPDEIARLVDHLWELKDIEQGYYFFDENCAYSLLGLIQVARPSAPMMEKLRLAESPVAAVRALIDKGFVDGSRYRPSKEVMLRWQADQLPADQRKLARQLANQPDLAQKDAFLALDQSSRFQVTELAYAWLRYRNSAGERDPQAARQSFALLRLMNTNAPTVDGNARHKAPPAPVSPDRGHGEKQWSLAAGQRDDVGFIDAQWRFTYHDWIDNNPGFLRGAEIKGLDITLRQYVNKPEQRPSNHLQLQRLQLVNIRSLAPRNAFVKPVSWFVDTGIERTLINQRHMTRYLQGGAGLAWQVGNTIPYAYAKARAENARHFAPFIETGAGSEIGLLYYRGRLAVHASLDGVYFVHDDWRSQGQLGLNWALGQHQAVRITATHERIRDHYVNEWGLAWRHYY